MRAARSAARHAVRDRVQLQVLLGGQTIVQRRVLEDDADAAAHLRRRSDHVDAGQPRRPGGRLQQRAQDLDRRRLARAVGAEKAEDLAGADGKPDPAHGLDLVVGLAKVLHLDGGGHVRLTRVGAAVAGEPGLVPPAPFRRQSARHAPGCAAAQARRPDRSPPRPPPARTPGSGSRRSRWRARRRCGTAPASSPRRGTRGSRAPSDQIAASGRSRTFSQVSVVMARAWWQGSATPSGVTRM